MHSWDRFTLSCRFLLLGPLCCLAGCALPPRCGLTADCTPCYRQVEILYTRSGTEHLIVSEDNPEAVESIIPASDESDQVADALSDVDQPSAQLQIFYPHPGGNPDLARAILRLSRGDPEFEDTEAGIVRKFRSGWKHLIRELSWGHSREPLTARSHGEEIRILDFPKEQLDLLIADLVSSGFFDDQKRPTGHVELDVHIDRGSVSKSWTAEPRLDDFIARVYRHGKPIVLVDPVPTEFSSRRLRKRITGMLPDL